MTIFIVTIKGYEQYNIQNKLMKILFNLNQDKEVTVLAVWE